tara:strand:+ start:587 stop:1003 length:417 start_codon:yes stop_codon:yes gene_type:complete
MLRKIHPDEQDHFIKDPVRPHIPNEFRVSEPNETYVYSFDDQIDAVICVAYTRNVPMNEQELKIVGDEIATFYTVWSYTKGAGTNIILAVKEYIEKNKPNVKRFVTLSPCTEMATRFHIKNGAVLLNKYEEFQNFEYK